MTAPPPSNPLETALALLAEGLWPVPITAPDDPAAISPGKQPIGAAWGARRHTPESLRRVYRDNPGAGVGLKLGPDGGVVDVEVDDPAKARATLERIFGAALPPTRGWSSARGTHLLFRWDDRLAGYGKALVKDHPSYPGVEFRFGSASGQFQSVCPPSVGTDGSPRVWNGHAEVLPLPDSVFNDLDLYLVPPHAGGGASSSGARRAPEDDGPYRPWDAERRATAYLAKCEPAVSGRRGHDKAFKAACKVGPGFDLDPETAYRLLRDHYNPRCEPPWSEKELRHKVEDAYRVETRRGWLLDADPGRKPGPAGPAEVGEALPPETFDDPFRLAREFLEERTTPEGYPTLRYWLEEWHQWDGSRYLLVPPAEVSAAVALHCKRRFDAAAADSGRPPAKVTRGVVGNVVSALTGLCLLPQAACPDRPAWLDDDPFPGEDRPSPLEVIPARNGLIHLPALIEGRRGLIPPTPAFFSPNCLDFDFLPDAPRPDHWLKFLSSIWPGDEGRESIDALQEWFGYLLTPETAQQKMLVVIGPPGPVRGPSRGA